MNSLRLVLSITSVLSLVACGSSTPATTPADAATSINPNVTAICATVARLDCPLGANVNCARDVMGEFNSTPARCAAQRDAFFACAARATTSTCAMIAEGHFAGCATAETALGTCADGDASVAPTDAGSAPTDTGSAVDAGAAECGATGAECCAGSDPCRAGATCNTTSNRCEVCGADGQICCPATTATCGAGLRCNAELRCSSVVCGEEGEACCATDGGAPCSGTNRCESGTCRAPF